jgi:hypothetical protein
MDAPLTPRQEAEAIEAFGDDLAKLDRAFTDLCQRMSAEAIERINAIPGQDLCEAIEGFRRVGDQMSRECDVADEAEDRRRDNPLEPDHRRLAQ